MPICLLPIIFEPIEQTWQRCWGLKANKLLQVPWKLADKSRRKTLSVPWLGERLQPVTRILQHGRDRESKERKRKREKCYKCMGCIWNFFEFFPFIRDLSYQMHTYRETGFSNSTFTKKLGIGGIKLWEKCFAFGMCTLSHALQFLIRKVM